MFTEANKKQSQAALCVQAIAHTPGLPARSLGMVLAVALQHNASLQARGDSASTTPSRPFRLE